MKNENNFWDKITIAITIVCVVAITFVGTLLLKAENANNSQIIKSDESDIIKSQIDEAFADSPVSDNEYNIELYGVININTANKDELMLLDGVGEKRAEAIIEYRIKHPFKNISEITKISGIGKKTYEKIKNKISVE